MSHTAIETPTVPQPPARDAASPAEEAKGLPIPYLTQGEVGMVRLPGPVSEPPASSRVTVELAGRYEEPVVLAQPLSDNDPAAAVVRLHGVEKAPLAAFELYLQEAPNEDRHGASEEVAYLVIESGPAQLADGTQLEAGRLETDATVGPGVRPRWERIDFSAPFEAPPAVLAQVLTSRDRSWVKTRVRDVTRTGFELAMEEEEASTAPHGRELVGWMAIDAARGTWSDRLFVSGNQVLSWAAGGEGRIYFGPARPWPPGLRQWRFLAALSSYLDPDPAWLRYRDLGPGGVTVRIQEDTTRDRETDHGPERLSYLAVDGDGPLAVQPLVFAAGTVGQTRVDHERKTVSLGRSFVDLVVIAQPISYDGGDPAFARITTVGDDAFELYVQEPYKFEDPDATGWHVLEEVSYLALEAGSWHLPAPPRTPTGPEFPPRRLEVGKIVTDATVGIHLTDEWAQVTFSERFPVAPVVVAQVQGENDPSPVKTRIRNVTDQGFEVALEGEERATTKHGPETIGWLALEPGTGRWLSPSGSAHPYAARTTGESFDETWKTIQLGSDVGAAPRFLAAIVSHNGGDSVALRYRNLTGTRVEVMVEEDWSEDSEVGHLEEAVAFLALGGDGVLGATPRPKR